MIIRGICCLIPGVEGKTENIHIISIVGRFLEHSRIYVFGTGTEQEVYIASADFMTRNTLRRVEVAVPVWDDALKTQINEMFITMLSDNQQARVEDNTGTYNQVEGHDTKLSAQQYFLDAAWEDAHTSEV